MTIQTKRIIVTGNGKDGCGKSTTAMQLISGFLHHGFSVGCIDLDPKKMTLSNYLDNRRQFISQKGKSLTMPEIKIFNQRPKVHSVDIDAEDEVIFSQIIIELSKNNDVIIIDTSGVDCHLSRLGHSFADILITPIYDILGGLESLVQVDTNSLKIKKLGCYAEMVWQQKKRRAGRDGTSIDWVVLRNRLNLNNPNDKQELEYTSSNIANRIGFRMVIGFTERVIYKQLFPKGLAVMDLFNVVELKKLKMSHITARQEVRNLIRAIGFNI